MKPEKKARQTNPEFRLGMPLEQDKPIVNLFGYARLVEPAEFSVGDVRIMKMATAILVMVILGFAAFLVVRL
jgi:hypothetical protein